MGLFFSQQTEEPGEYLNMRIYADIFFNGQWNVTWQEAVLPMRQHVVVHGRYGTATHLRGLVALQFIRYHCWAQSVQIESLCMAGEVVEVTISNGRARIHEIRDDAGNLARAKIISRSFQDRRSVAE